MTFRPRPYDPDRENKQTDAQRAASLRNFEIFKLRGLWSQAGMLMEPQRTAVRALIDVDLRERRALPQREHERRRRNKLNSRLEREYRAQHGHDLPF